MLGESILSRAAARSPAAFALVLLGAVAGQDRTIAQPEEIRVRTLGISSSGVTIEAKDVLGTQGIVFRDALPGQFWARLPGPVGDVNGDGFDDLAVFWGAIGNVIFEELFLVYGRADNPRRIDRENISQFATRFLTTRFLQRDPGLRNFGALPRSLPAGDVDQDGYADFFVGVRSDTPIEYSDVTPGDGVEYLPGIVYLVHGAAAFPDTVDLVDPPDGLRIVRFSSTKPNKTKLGEDMCGGGDLDGDGTADFAFAAPVAHPADAFPGISFGPGRVYVLFGSADGYLGLLDLEEIGASLPGVILEGDRLAQGFGMEVSFAGDVDGDGLDDLMIGVTAIGGSGPVLDHMLLLYGSRQLPSRLGAGDVIASQFGTRFVRTSALTDARQSFAPLGDVNGDGLDDIVVGSPGEYQGRGAAYIVFGSPSFPDSVELSALVSSGDAIRIIGEGTADFGVLTGNGVGSALARMDYNLDGVVDLLIGSARTVVNGVREVGRAYILEGPFERGSWPLDGFGEGGLTGSLVTSEVPEWLGLGVYHLGDMNGDGRPDLCVAAPYVYGTSPNHWEPGLSPDPSFYVVFGTGGEPVELRIDEVCPLIGPLEGGSEVTLFGQGFGEEVAVSIGGRPAEIRSVESSSRLVVEVPEGETAGPADVVVERGAERTSAEGLFRYVSTFYSDVDLGSPTSPSRLTAIDAGGGRAAALDFNGDGPVDVAIDTLDGVVIVYGGPGLSDSRVTVLPFEDVPEGAVRFRFSDRRGHEPFAVGDVNTDGIPDLAVVSEGVVSILFGGTPRHGSVEVAELLETGGATLVSFSGDERLGVAGVGDFDGDGVGDIVLFRRFEVNLVRGRAVWPPLRGLALEPTFRIPGTPEHDAISAALVGDVDGDGRSELLIGAPGLFWADRGNGYLVFGRTGFGIEQVEELAASGDALRIQSVKERDSLGYQVSQVGDFNGDGVPDFGISALAGALEFAGESYVVFGGRHLRDEPSIELAELGHRGLRIRGEFGYDLAADIASTGDFNGDGRLDLLVSGGNLTDANNPFPSRSFVVFGGATGLLNLAKVGEDGFRIRTGDEAVSIGGGDVDGDGFSDAIVRRGDLIHVIYGFGQGPLFIRGDSDGNRIIELSDAIAILNYLFLGFGELRCRDAADADDSGTLELTDAVFILGYLFLGTAAPPPPFPEAGADPTEDGVDCR